MAVTPVDLDLSTARRIWLHAQRTRFITRAMLPLYDDILWPALKPLPDELTALRANVDLRAQMRTMWAK